MFLKTSYTFVYMSLQTCVLNFHQDELKYFLHLHGCEETVGNGMEIVSVKKKLSPSL